MRLLLATIPCIFFCGPLAAQEEVLPSGFPLTRYTSEWENSPFTREVVKAVQTKIASTFGKNLVLEGFVNDQKRGPIAYVRDTKENTPFTITSEKGSAEYPFQIVSASKDNDPSKTTVTITDGEETTDIGFASNLLTQAIQQPQQAPREQPGKGGKKPGSARGTAIKASGHTGTPQVQPAGKTRKTSSVSSTDSDKSGSRPQITQPLDRLDERTPRRSVPLPKGSNN